MSRVHPQGRSTNNNQKNSALDDTPSAQPFRNHTRHTSINALTHPRTIFSHRGYDAKRDLNRTERQVELNASSPELNPEL